MRVDQRVDLDALNPNDRAPTAAQLGTMSPDAWWEQKAREEFAQLPLRTRLFRRRPPGLGWWQV